MTVPLKVGSCSKQGAALVATLLVPTYIYSTIMFSAICRYGTESVNFGFRLYISKHSNTLGMCSRDCSFIVGYEIYKEWLCYLRLRAFK